MNQNQAELESLIGGANDYQTLTHYNGETVLEYSPSLHAYTTLIDVDGEERRVLVAGVTSVVGMIDKSAPLTQWAANMTVEWFIDNFPAVEARSDLIQCYERYTSKVPWEDDVDGLASSFVDRVRVKDIAKLLNEARFNYRAISKDATNVGHLAHEWLEGWVKALIAANSEDAGVLTAAGEAYAAATPVPSPKVDGKADERAANCIRAALAWFSKHKFRPVFSEKKLCSRRYGYAGTCDWLAYVTGCGDHHCCPFDGEALELGDFKSSRSLYDEYFCQLAAYRSAIEEEFPELEIGACTLLRLGKDDGEFETRSVTVEDFESDFVGFLGCLDMYFWQKQRDLNARYEKKLKKALAKADKESEKAAEKEAKAAAKAVKAAAQGKPKRVRKPVKRPVVREVCAVQIGIEVEGEAPATSRKSSEAAFLTIPIEEAA